MSVVAREVMRSVSVKRVDDNSSVESYTHREYQPDHIKCDGCEKTIGIHAGARDDFVEIRGIDKGDVQGRATLKLNACSSSCYQKVVDYILSRKYSEFTQIEIRVSGSPKTVREYVTTKQLD